MEVEAEAGHVVVEEGVEAVEVEAVAVLPW